MNRLFLITCIFFVLLAAAYAGEIYTYKDKYGNNVLSNIPIPEKYEKKAKKTESYKDSTPSERKQWEKENEARDQAYQKGEEIKKQSMVRQNPAQNMLQFNIEDARTNLKRAANESNFMTAKDYARRAENSLDGAAMSALIQNCIMSNMEFDSAATYARRAKDASSPQEFNNLLNGAIRSFNSALNASQRCPN